MARPRHDIDPDTAEMLREYYEIARTVRGHMPLDHPARKTSELLTELLAELNNGGASASSLDRAMGSRTGTAWERMVRHGYKTRPSGSAGPTYKQVQYRIADIPRRTPDLTGQRFNHLTAVRSTGEMSRLGAMWMFLCDCGAERIAPGPQVKAGNIKSCGGCGRRANHRRPAVAG